MKEFDVVIIGAGGAGMFCASQAAKRGRSVALLDHATKIGKKILISGGGRCNFTNIHASPSQFVSQNPHFCKSALAQFTPQDFIQLVRKHRISFHEKKLGQLFCDGSAKSIVDLLVAECENAGAVFFTDCQIEHVEKSDIFKIQTSQGMFACQSLVIATGGLSIPQIGATGFGYTIARQFGLRIITPAPALDGFEFDIDDRKRFKDLSGVSLDSIVTCRKAAFRENVLFTHTGLSGPASLQASLYWNLGDELIIDLLPELDAGAWLKEVKRSGVRLDLKNVLCEKLPKRFAERLCQIYAVDGKLFQISDRQIDHFAYQLNHFCLKPKSTVGYRKAEVTKGGVDTDQLSSKTMCAKEIPGLYFIGEVLDVTGQLGGYNFQWAWSSGFAAGQNA